MSLPQKTSSSSHPEIRNRRRRGWNRWHSLSAISAAAVVIGVTCLVVSHRLHRHRPVDPLAAAGKVNRPEFAQMPERTQRRYERSLAGARPQLLAAVREGRITEAEYETAYREGWLGRMERRAHRFASLGDPLSRRRYLDRLIDAHERAAAQVRTRPRVTVAFVRERVTTWSTEHRQELLQFFRAVQQRRLQRSLPADPQYPSNF